jgi:hypothetical protein
MISDLIQQLRSLNGVAFHNGVNDALLTKFRSEHGLTLPVEHQDLLRWSNGVEADDGYIRLFGVYTTDAIDAIVWNNYDFWKFAWGDKCSLFWCLGETAWGDQYAYRVESLWEDGPTPVFFLEALSMTPELVASCFGEFLQNEFLRSAKGTYGAMTHLGHQQKFGTLETASHLVYVPSILLCGPEDVANVEKVNARAAMVCNGDIATQLDTGPPDGRVKSVQAYEDEMKRTRLRLVWA